jgi:D-3-phosphoglycerate dehydrogenase
VLKLTLHSSEGDTSASATVLHGNSPRLLAYDGIDIEAPLNGTLVVIRNHDVPGVVGRIGTILGEHQVNIANFALGRSTRSQHVPQGQALAVVQIDVPTAQEAAPALAALKKVEAIVSVRLVELGKS